GLPIEGCANSAISIKQNRERVTAGRKAHYNPAAVLGGARPKRGKQSYSHLSCGECSEFNRVAKWSLFPIGTYSAERAQFFCGFRRAADFPSQTRSTLCDL